jgi:hypothetical protein
MRLDHPDQGRQVGNGNTSYETRLYLDMLVATARNPQQLAEQS